MSDIKIINLNEKPQGFGDIADNIENTMFVSSLPRQHTHSYYENTALGLYLGLWDTTDIIATAAPYAYDEFMIIIEGVVEIKNSQTGTVEIATTGDSIIIPQGYDCQWHQKDYLLKFRLIYQPPEQSVSEQPTCDHIVFIDEKHANAWQETSDGFNKKVLYQSHNQKFTSGVWQANSFSTGMITFPYNEFIVLKQGSLLCTDESGVVYKISKGQALFVPQGTPCSWQAKAKTSLLFVQISSK